MKSVSDTMDLKHKKSLRLGLLLFSTVFIISASAVVYASMVYEKALEVGNTGGAATGSGSTASAEVSFTPAAIMMLVVAGVVVGLSVFVFLHRASKNISNPSGGPNSSRTGPVSPSLEVPGISLPSHLPSPQEEEWEESRTKKEESSASSA
jgi:hypothetical protein